MLTAVYVVDAAGTIMSYAKDSKSTDDDQRIADFNHFVIFDPRNLLACHDVSACSVAQLEQQQ
jgi:ferritin-like protein